MKYRTKDKPKRFCKQCGIKLTHWDQKQFCSRSCAGTYNNLHSSPDRKRGPVAKPKIPKISKKHERILNEEKPYNIEIVGVFTSIYKNICAKSGLSFYSKSYRKYHPNLKETRADYARSCQFNFQMNKFPDWFDGSIIKEHGWYSTPGSRCGKKNVNGVSRDHMVSIAYGWEHDINPVLIRHPANCELVLHRDNQRKNFRSSISLNDLKQRIIDFEKIYPNWYI